jgi:hypothetical protein
MRGRAVVVWVLVTAFAGTACSGAAELVAAQPSSSAAPTSSPPGDAGAALPEPLPHPTDDTTSDGAALVAGTAAMTAFARPDLSPDEWWAGLAPLLSPAATEAYLATDPAEVPAHEVTGPAWLGVTESAFLALVFVPTDAGEYAILLVREGGGAPWLVERISPVESGAATGGTTTPSEPPS